MWWVHSRSSSCYYKHKSNRKIPSSLQLLFAFICCHAAAIHCRNLSVAATPVTTTIVSNNSTKANGDIEHEHEYQYNLRRRLLLNNEESTPSQQKRKEPIRILYTITTLAEYDRGTRATTRVSSVIEPESTRLVSLHSLLLQDVNKTSRVRAADRLVSFFQFF